ncbi:DedA family protein [Cohnella zeiphila]|uniref:DedA family protein n=1 Tax=Cohnella zeiphila TaxID=2761120 RepID=A0A7X0VYZ8_9BACL|nr:DedA family protein [Cohnella zeiphila]MBB6735909.1 DedA family protein [Cohnella zeiphila]
MNAMAFVERLFEHYGYLLLLLGLPLDFIALPLPPGNSTLAYAGYLAQAGKLSAWPTLGAALAGAFIGVTVTYALGCRFGEPLLLRYGKYVFLKPSTLERVRRAYGKHGNKALLILFFVPGLRQFVGYFIGVIRVPVRTVILYAFPGTALWVLFFFGIGYRFGGHWEDLLKTAERYLGILSVCAGALLIGFIVWKKRRTSSKREREAERMARRG